jgi:uracil-DNA glycosylase family 4
MNLWEQMKGALSADPTVPVVEIKGVPDGYKVVQNGANFEIVKSGDEEGEKELDRIPTVPPAGPRDAPVAFVTARASEIDVIRGRPLCGPAGETLRMAYLKGLDLDREHVFLMALVPEFLQDEHDQPRAPTKEEVEEWRPWFTKQLHDFAPKTVVALGTDARDALGDLADDWVPHPLVIRKHGDWGEVKRKLVRIKKAVDKNVGLVRKEIRCRFLKSEHEQRLVLGVVLEPNVPDAHDDVFSVEEIRKAAHQFMRDSQTIGLQHMVATSFPVVESFLASQDLQFGDETVAAGSWLMNVFVENDAAWSAVKSGEFTGFSINGLGKRVPISA